MTYKPAEVEVPKRPEEDGGPSLDQPQKGAGAWADPLYQPNPTAGDNNRGSAYFQPAITETPKADNVPSMDRATLDQPQKGAGAWADPLYQPNPADKGYRLISDRPFGTDI
jgi:hypothetical protein